MKRTKVPWYAIIKEVTPFVGVWIETYYKNHLVYYEGSHPSWVCGLKQGNWALPIDLAVTPFVGVWIETTLKRFLSQT